MHDGLILALVSIGVVFAALLILYLFYGLMGKLFMRQAPARPRAQAPEDDEEAVRMAAAIAVALELENSRKITIHPSCPSWKTPEYGFRKAVSPEGPATRGADCVGSPLRPVATQPCPGKWSQGATRNSPERAADC
ncbi:MAG: OadG family protein [Bacteroidales bacterium]|nr:OadG family protein [Bacteroidales bacterium]